jgi:hypothetical protein
MFLPFENVREKLLRAGIAPRHARRYITELREHLSDLTAQERAAGHDAREADKLARAKLGTDTELAEALIAKPEFRSIATRAPWAVFGIVPPMLVFGFVTLSAIVQMNMLFPYMGPLGNINAMPTWMPSVTATIMFVSNYLVGPLAALAIVLIAVRQRMTSAWPWISLVLIALFSGFFGLHGGNGEPFKAAHMSLADIALRATTLLIIASAAYYTLLNRTSHENGM